MSVTKKGARMPESTDHVWRSCISCQELGIDERKCLNESLKGQKKPVDVANIIAKKR